MNKKDICIILFLIIVISTILIYSGVVNIRNYYIDKESGIKYYSDENTSDQNNNDVKFLDDKLANIIPKYDGKQYTDDKSGKIYFHVKDIKFMYLYDNDSKYYCGYFEENKNVMYYYDISSEKWKKIKD